MWCSVAREVWHQAPLNGDVAQPCVEVTHLAADQPGERGEWVTKAYTVRIGANEATCVRVRAPEALPSALADAGLTIPSPVVVLVGGAGGLDATALSRLAPMFTAGLVPALRQSGAVAVDGGTDAGVMRLLGEAHATGAGGLPLVGVAAEGTVRVPGMPSLRDDAADLEPHHTHFILVPGSEWGAEASWIALTASCLAGPAPSVTVLVNGGDIAYQDAKFSLRAGRRILVIGGSGRAADEIAAATRGEPCDPRARGIAESGLVSCVDAENPSAVRDAVTAALGPADG